MLHQVGPLLEAALAFWTHVGLEEGLGARSHIPLQLLSPLAFLQGFLGVLLAATLFFLYVLFFS